MQDENREYEEEEEEQPRTQADEERERLERNRSAYGRYDRQASENEYMINAARNAYRSADKKDKGKGIAVLVLALIGFFGAFVSMMCRFFPGIFIFISLFVGTIIITIIITVVKQAQSLSDKNFSPEQKYGVVLSCITSSTSSTNHSITSVVYRLLINVDGKEYTAYARQFYNVGDTVVVRLHNNPEKMMAHIDIDASFQSEMRKIAAMQRAAGYVPENEPITQEAEIPSDPYDLTAPSTPQAPQEPVPEQVAQEPTVDTPQEPTVRVPPHSTQTPNSDSTSTVRKPRKLK